jgi:hypothetical protein
MLGLQLEIITADIHILYSGLKRTRQRLKFLIQKNI